MRTLDATNLLGAFPLYALTGAALSFATTARNTAVLYAAASPLTLSVLAPEDYAGTYEVDAGTLADGPAPLRPPAIAGEPAVGAPLTVRPALWAYDGTAVEPARSWQWQRDGVDIPDATSASFTPAAEDAGAALRVVEAASGAGGTSASTSASVVVPA
jgi:hypothetical protein